MRADAILGVCRRTQMLPPLLLLLLLVYFAFREHSVSIALCVWQSFSPPSQSYSRSDRAYQNLSAVIDAYGGGGWLSPSLPTDKATVHSYVRVYDTLLAPLRSSVAAVLEVGVKKGGSLVLWREHFASEARIYGLEVDASAPSFPLDAGLKVVAGVNSTDAASVRRAFGGAPRFDLIVDDGCHLLRCIFGTFRATHPLLRDDGLYIVEDFPVYGLPRRGGERHGSQRLWDLLSGHGRRHVCVLSDTEPTEVLVLVYQPRSTAPRLCPWSAHPEAAVMSWPASVAFAATAEARASASAGAGHATGLARHHLHQHAAVAAAAPHRTHHMSPDDVSSHW